MDAIQVSEFAIAFASWIKADVGVLVIIIIMSEKFQIQGLDFLCDHLPCPQKTHSKMLDGV